MFDLKADPTYGELKRALEAECDKQSKAIAFRILDFADGPPDDGSLPNAAGKKQKNKL